MIHRLCIFMRAWIKDQSKTMQSSSFTKHNFSKACRKSQMLPVTPQQVKQTCHLLRAGAPLCLQVDTAPGTE